MPIELTIVIRAIRATHPQRHQAPNMEYLQERTTNHMPDYTATVKLCVRKLAQAYSDLGMSKEEQLQAFDKVAAAAEAVWTDACEGVDVERQALRDRVEKDLTEAIKIREALGDDEADLELSQCKEEAASPRVTLRSLHERVLRRLEHWKGRRAERMLEFEAIMAVTCTLKSHLGQTQPVTRPDLSRANLDFLRMEHDKLRAEKEKRVTRLASLLEQLHQQCQELGESSKAAMSEVHHSLWHFRAGRQMGEVGIVTPAAGSTPGRVTAPTQDPLLQGVELGDAMFDRLAAKLDGLAALRTERETQLQQLSAVLGSLWEALTVAPSAPERASVSELIQGPTKLQAATIDACGAEVSRLEQQQSRAMKDLVVSKAMELEQLCAASLMEAPDVTELLLDMSQPNRRDSVAGSVGQGQVSDVLSKMMRLIVEVRSEASKRVSLVAEVKQLEEAQQELVWLQKYEQDDNRFKGRDAHSNLQRSLRAAKQRERVPGIIRSLQQAAQAWRLREGAPFLVHGQDYAEEVLPELSRQLEQSLAEKPPAPKSRSASSGGAAPAAPKAPAGPSRGSMGGAAGRAGERQHALTHQGLAERHSISVPLGVAGGAGPNALGGPRDGASNKLSRSIDFKSDGGGGPISRAAAATAAAAAVRRTPPPAARPVGTPARRPASVSPAPQGPPLAAAAASSQLTPVRSGSSVDRAAAAAVATPGADPLQEKMARIIAQPSSGGKAGRAAPGRYPTTPTSSSKGLALDVVAAAGCDDVQSPRDNAKAARAAEAARAAAAAVVPSPKGLARPEAAGRAGGQSLKAQAVAPSPIKTSRIPRFNL